MKKRYEEKLARNAKLKPYYKMAERKSKAGLVYTKLIKAL